jgi:hypothetical protein
MVLLGFEVFIHAESRSSRSVFSLPFGRAPLRVSSPPGRRFWPSVPAYPRPSAHEVVPSVFTTACAAMLAFVRLLQRVSNEILRLIRLRISQPAREFRTYPE